MDIQTEKMDMTVCPKSGIDATAKTKAEGFLRGVVEPARMLEELLDGSQRKRTEYGFQD